MDMDDFEFRPLTKGLGFDKTAETKASRSRIMPSKPQASPAAIAPKKTVIEPIKAVSFTVPEQDFELSNPAPVSRSLKKMLDSLPPSVNFIEDKQRELQMRAPMLPEEPILEQPPFYQPPVHRPQTTGFDITLDNSLSQAFPKEEVNKRFYHQMVTPVAQFKEVPSSFASAIIDGLIVLGLSSLFVVILVAITKIDIIAMMTHRELSSRVAFELIALCFGVNIFYFMLARGLFGSTLGDWAFDVQLGSENERGHIMYPFQVIFRTTLIILSGLFVVPLVSLAFGKDIAYYFSGLKLYSRQY